MIRHFLEHFYKVLKRFPHNNGRVLSSADAEENRLFINIGGEKSV